MRIFAIKRRPECGAVESSNHHEISSDADTKAGKKGRKIRRVNLARLNKETHLNDDQGRILQKGKLLGTPSLNISAFLRGEM